MLTRKHYSNIKNTLGKRSIIKEINFSKGTDYVFKNGLVIDQVDCPIVSLEITFDNDRLPIADLPDKLIMLAEEIRHQRDIKKKSFFK